MNVPTPSPTGADDVTERMRKLADAIERSNLSPYLHALPDELRSFATAFEALTKELALERASNKARHE